jgi:hypothetical protein
MSRRRWTGWRRIWRAISMSRPFWRWRISAPRRNPAKHGAFFLASGPDDAFRQRPLIQINARPATKRHALKKLIHQNVDE